MKKSRRILLPILVLGGMVLTSCSSDLAVEWGPEDQTIPTEWVDYHITPTGVKFAAGEENLYLEWNSGPHAYKYSVTPNGATGASLVWTSSNESAATVADGVLTPVGPGATTITVSEATNAFTPVTIEAHITKQLESFDVTAPTLELDINKSYTFTPSFTPSDTTYQELIWEIPADEAEYASVSNGVLTTKGDRTTDTTIHLTVSSGACETVKKFDLHLKDRKIHVNSIALALGQGESNNIEIGYTSSVVATVDPANADDLGELKYYSREPEIATVDPDSGVITAVSAGVAHIFAHCEDKDSSEDIAITVYEVFATAVHIDKTHDYTVSNDDANEKSIVVTYETSVTGKDIPSRARATFTSSDVSVVRVDKDTGLLSAVSTGTATITASVAKEDGSLATDTVEVSSNVYATSIAISGDYSCYLDSTVTLTATVSPASAVDGTVSWSWTPATRATGVASGNSITLTPTEEGPLVVKAESTHFGVSETHTVSFSERPVVFENGVVYLVGDKQFNTGSSVTGQASWTNPKYAYAITELAASDDPKVSKQYKATIHFNSGDQWKLREGPLDTGWKDLFDYEMIDGQSVKVDYYEIAGALDGTYMRPDSTKSGNIHVLVEGSYDIYYKVLVAGGYRIYIGLTPSISFDKPSITLGSGASTKITLHNYAEGAINITNSDPTIATVSSGTATTSGMEYTVTAGSASGSTTITATDVNGKQAMCHVTVDAGSTGVNVPIYLNANGIFDKDGAVPFVYGYKSDTVNNSFKMSKVSGQDIIYSADIPEDYVGAIFVRMPGGSTTLDWNEAWNQTKASDELFGSNNMFTITGYEQIEEKSYLTGSWGVYDENIHYKAPAEYYLVGSFNGWATYDDEYGFTKVSDTTYKLENVVLSANAELKAHDKDLKNVPVEESGPHWYTNTSNGSHYTVQTSGDHNIVISDSGTYTVTYTVGASNPLSFALEGEGGGGGGESKFDDYIIHYGTPEEDDWADVQLTLSSGVYTGEVTLTAGQEMVLHLTGDVWRGYADLDSSSKALSNITDKEQSNNIVCVTGATFVVTLNAELESNSINITVKGDTPTPPDPGDFDLNKKTIVNVIDQTNKGFTEYGVDIKLHIFDITFAEGSPITSVSGLQSNNITIGDSVTYNTTLNEIDVLMTWVTNDDGVTYTATLPAYIQSCKICIYNTNNAWVHQVHVDQEGYPIDDDSYQFTTTREKTYKLYLFNNGDPAYGAWPENPENTAFNSPLSLVIIN